MNKQALRHALFSTVVAVGLMATSSCSGCNTTLITDLVVIKYQQSIMFGSYRENDQRPSRPGIFVAFKLARAVDFSFDPTRVEIQDPDTALQVVNVATKPAQPRIVRAGEIYDIGSPGGSIIFKIDTPIGFKQKFRLVYIDPTKHVLFVAEPDVSSEWRDFVTRAALQTLGI